MLDFSHFIEFLYKEKCLMIYFDAINKEVVLNKTSSMKSRVRTIMKQEPKNFVNYAFYWGDTKEGHVFWADIHRKWIWFVNNER